MFLRWRSFIPSLPMIAGSAFFDTGTDREVLSFSTAFSDGVRRMNTPLPICPGLREGNNYPSPVTRVLALGYYDGPTNGVLQCGDGGPVCKFNLIEGPFSTEDGLWDMRVFAV